MASTTSTIACPADVWTEIAVGAENVAAQMFTASGAMALGFRVAVGTVAPDNSVVNFGLLITPASGGYSSKGLTARVDNVYVWPLGLAAGASGIAQVIAS